MSRDAKRSIELADSLVAQLNQQAWPVKCRFARSWFVFVFRDLPISPEPLVRVIPWGRALSAGRRRVDFVRWRLGLVVQQKLDANVDETRELELLDSLVRLCEQLWEFIEPTADTPALELAADSTGDNAADWVETEHEDGRIFSEEDYVRRGRLFTSIATFTFEDRR